MLDGSVKRMTLTEANQDPAVHWWSETEPCVEAFVGRAPAIGAIIGSGDTTTTISDPNDKSKPYRFKEGTKAGQKAEIRRVMEERFQRDNKAPWKVDVDVSEY